MKVKVNDYVVINTLSRCSAKTNDICKVIRTTPKTFEVFYKDRKVKFWQKEYNTFFGVGVNNNLYAEKINIPRETFTIKTFLNDIWLFSVSGTPKEIINLFEDIEDEFGENCFICFDDYKKEYYVEYEELESEDDYINRVKQSFINK